MSISICFRSFVLVLFVLGLPWQGRSQTTVRYCEEDTKYYTQCWTFVQTGKRTGTFKHVFIQDDRQVWIGVGTYKETRKKLRLTYDPGALSLKTVRVQASPDRVDSVLISWENVLGVQDYFQVIYTNPAGEEVVVESDIHSQKVCLFYRDLGVAVVRVVLLGQEIATIPLNVYQTEQVHVQANQPGMVHALSLESLVFRKLAGALVWMDGEREKKAKQISD